MAVAVDDRMLDLGVNLRGAQMTGAAHGVPPKRWRWDLVEC
jgi:hypothetical protein